MCWRRGQGRLASSKGPPLPKPTHPAATSPDGPAPRDPLKWTPSQTLLEAVRRFLLPKAGAPSPHSLLKDLDTSLPLGPQLPHHVHPASNWQLHSLLPSQGKAPLLNAHRCEVLVTPATITHTQCHCQIPSSYGYMGYGQSYTETQFPCEGHGGNDSPNHSVRLGGVSESVPGGGIQGDIMTPPCLCFCRPPGKRLPAPRKPETASLTQPCRTVSHPPWPTVFTDGPVSKV